MNAERFADPWLSRSGPVARGDEVSSPGAGADILVAVAAGRLGMSPTSDFALPVVAHALGLRAEAGEVIFAVARIAGWIAHAVEEYAADSLHYRLAGVYTGVRPPG